MSDLIKTNFELTPDIIKLLRKCDENIQIDQLNFKSIEDVWEFMNSVEKELDEKLQESENINLKEHMEQLHKYNEIKDITQEVLGSLANILGISVSEAHKKYNLGDGS